VNIFPVNFAATRRGDMHALINLRKVFGAGIVVRPRETLYTQRVARIFQWTPALEQAVAQAKAARPIDISPWLFCTRKGQGYFDENGGQATGWDSMWQRFTTQLLQETDIQQRFTEHDLRGKVGSDLVSIERAAELLGHASKEVTKRHYRSKAPLSSENCELNGGDFDPPCVRLVAASIALYEVDATLGVHTGGRRRVG